MGLPNGHTPSLDRKVSKVSCKSGSIRDSSDPCSNTEQRDDCNTDGDGARLPEVSGQSNRGTSHSPARTESPPFSPIGASGSALDMGIDELETWRSATCRPLNMRTSSELDDLCTYPVVLSPYPGSGYGTAQCNDADDPLVSIHVPSPTLHTAGRKIDAVSGPVKLPCSVSQTSKAGTGEASFSTKLSSSVNQARAFSESQALSNKQNLKENQQQIAMGTDILRSGVDPSISSLPAKRILVYTDNALVYCDSFRESLMNPADPNGGASKGLVGSSAPAARLLRVLRHALPALSGFRYLLPFLRYLGPHSTVHGNSTSAFRPYRDQKTVSLDFRARFARYCRLTCTWSPFEV
jgi:hypothetical protein